MKISYAKRIPPGDRWQVGNELFESLTECLNEYFSERPLLILKWMLVWEKYMSMMVKRRLKNHLKCGICMEKKVKSDAIYNHWDNMVYIKTDGDMIYVVCNKENQMDDVNKRFYGSGNELIGYEEWDEGKDKKWIMTWKVPSGFDKPIEYN